jgi:alanyl-tRNA synthetase
VRKELVKKAETINGIKFIGQFVESSNPDMLKKLCFDLKSELDHFFVVLVSSINGKAYVAITLDDALSASKDLDAQKIIKTQVAPLIQGGGGGQKTLATAGGQDISQLPQVIDSLKKLIS